MAPKALRGSTGGRKGGIITRFRTYVYSTFFEKSESAKKNLRVFWNFSMFTAAVGLIAYAGHVLDPPQAGGEAAPDGAAA